MEQQIAFVPETTISEFVASINALRDEKTMKRLTIKSITEELLARRVSGAEVLERIQQNLSDRKKEKRWASGQKRESQNGNLVLMSFYTGKAQRYVVELLKRNTTAD